MVSDDFCNTVKSTLPQESYKEWQIMLGEHLVLVTLYRDVQSVSSKTIRIGGTKYHIIYLLFSVVE